MSALSFTRRFFSSDKSFDIEEAPTHNQGSPHRLDRRLGPNEMIFGPLDLDESGLHDDHHIYHGCHTRDSSSDVDSDNPSPHFFTMPLSPQPAIATVDDLNFDSVGFYSPPEAQYADSFADPYMAEWTKDTGMSPVLSPTSPIPIPYVNDAASTDHGYMAFPTFDSSPPLYPQTASFSPAEFLAPHPLPDVSTAYSGGYPTPSSITGDQGMTDSSSPFFTEETKPSYFGEHFSHSHQQPQPQWASDLWGNPSFAKSDTTIRPVRHSLLSDRDRRRAVSQRGTSTLAHLFQSSSAPSVAPPIMSRPYSRKAEPEDNDATIRRRRSPPSTDDSEKAPLKSVLRPPKLAPSAWQLYFTDWIQRHQASSTRKLNVAQAAKEAGQEYATLTAEEKEPYKRKSQAAKEQREREMVAYMKSLSPDDIKRENVYRTEQRKLGKSRKSNIKDPNAPKKPLSAYFMFLQWIRASPERVHSVFGGETETTKQSVLAAARWRSMTDDERKPFLAQAEQEKLDYESARRLYEEGTPGPSTNINFSILPGSPVDRGFGNATSSGGFTSTFLSNPNPNTVSAEFNNPTRPKAEPESDNEFSVDDFVKKYTH